MSETFTLVDEAPEGAAPAEASASTAAPAAWTPGQSTFGPTPTKPESTKGPKQKRAQRVRRGSAIEDMPYKPLPEPAAKKKLSKGAQKAADKAQLVKEREADAATMRINGVDGNVEIPKKAWLTFTSAKRARPDEIAETLSDLASMLENSESERKAVSALAEQYAAYDIGEAYERVTMLLDRGVTLQAAMADQTDTFPPVVRELLGAANMPKDMHRNLRQAALIIVEADDIKGKIRNALFQPGFMFVLLLIFVVAAVQFMLPMTADMFKGIGAEPPQTTVIIMAVGEWLKWIVGGLIIVGMIFFLMWHSFLKRNERIATRADRASLNTPLLGDIVRMSVAARFCDVLSACLAVGMSELEALETAARACGNRAVQQWVNEHVSRQRFGIVGFSDVAKTDMFPWNFRNRIETTGSLTRRIEILRELAETFHAKAQLRLGRFAERIGPITQAVVIGTIVVVVLLVIAPILTFVPTMLDTIG